MMEQTKYLWASKADSLVSMGALTISEYAVMKAATDLFYDNPITTIGAVIELIESIESDKAVDWLWFTSELGSTTTQKAMSVMNTITSSQYNNPPIGKYVLIDFSTSPNTILDVTETNAVMNSPTRMEHTTVGFKHTEYLMGILQ